MKKAEAALIGWLVVIGIVIYPFVLLYKAIGGIGIGVIAAVIGGSIVAHYASLSKKRSKSV